MSKIGSKNSVKSVADLPVNIELWRYTVEWVEGCVLPLQPNASKSLLKKCVKEIYESTTHDAKTIEDLKDKIRYYRRMGWISKKPNTRK